MLDTLAPLTTWPNGWTVHRLTTPMPIPSDVGKWLLEHQLYAEGNDFTSDYAKEDPDYVGKSLLKRFWKGEKNRVNLQATAMDLWVLAKDGVPQGVVSWMRTDTPGEPFKILPTPEYRAHPNHKPREQIPAASLGAFMLYMKKEHRGAGLMRQTVMHFVAPEMLAIARQCRAQGGFPFIAAKDAAAALLEKTTHVPLVDELAPCMARDSSIWDFWTQAVCWPELRTTHHEFLMPPVKLPVKARKKQRQDVLDLSEHAPARQPSMR